MDMLVFAADVVAEGGAKALVEGWWVQGAASLVALITGYLGIIIRNWIKKTVAKADLNAAQTEALESLLEGMAKVQDDEVRALKESAADGKLSKLEVEKMQGIAWDHAKLVATGPAKDIVVSWSKDRVASLIKQLLAKYKGKK